MQPSRQGVLPSLNSSSERGGSYQNLSSYHTPVEVKLAGSLKAKRKSQMASALVSPPKLVSQQVGKSGYDHVNLQPSLTDKRRSEVSRGQSTLFQQINEGVPSQQNGIASMECLIMPQPTQSQANIVKLSPGDKVTDYDEKKYASMNDDLRNFAKS